MKHKLLLILIIIFFCLVSYSGKTSKPNLSLFNGRNLNGWMTTMPKLWSVKNNTIIGKHNGKIKRNNFLISKHTLRNFHLKFDVKLVGEKGNSGMQFWSIPIGNNGEVEGYQADIGPKYWGNLYHEHGKRKNRTLFRNPADKHIKKNDWNQYEIIAIDDKIKTIINGHTITDYTEKDKNAGRSYGQLAIQMHRGFGPMQIEVRNFQLKQLPSPPLSKLIKKKSSKKRPKSKLKGGNSNSPILSPEDEKKHFRLPKGFIAELVVSEKYNIKKIVDIAFDTKGRMWASTASEYPADEFKDGASWGDIVGKRTNISPKVKQLWEKGGIDQILIIENPTNNNKKKIHIFSEKRALPMGVLPYKNNSAIIIEGKNLLLLEDKNQNNKADKTTVLAHGFGKQDTHTGAHGLKYMPGDWVTVINGLLCWGDVTDSGGNVTKFDRTTIAYIKPNGRDFHIVAKGFHNIWGFYQDKVGQGWIQEANNTGYPIAPYYEQMKYFCFMKEVQLRPYTTLYPELTNISLEGSSLSGVEKSDDISGGFPEKWQEMFLLAHPTPSKIQSLELIKRKNQSFGLKRGEDFLVSKDPNFRPVDLEFGPDGCLYIVDWYNPIISHNEVKRNHPLRNKVATRVWRIRHKSQNPNKKITDMSKVPTKLLTQYLQSENSWELESAWKEISYRQDTSIVPKLKKLVKNKKLRPRFRIHALWSLESLRYFNLALWFSLLEDDNDFIRTQALRSMRTLHKDINQTFSAIQRLAKKETKFPVIKEIINYIGSCHQLSNEHIDFLLNWRANITPKERNNIHSRNLPFTTYTKKHYEDIMRMALEKHPQSVSLYLQQTNDPLKKDFITQYIIPYLPSKYLNQILSSMTPSDLKNTKLLEFVIRSNTSKSLKLIQEYFAKLSAKKKIKLILQLNIKPNRTINQLLQTSVNKLHLKSTLLGSFKQEKLFLHAYLYLGKNFQSSRKGRKELTYFKRLIQKFPSLQSLVAQIFVKTRKQPPYYSIFSPVYTQLLYTQLTEHSNFVKNHQQNLTTLIQKSSNIKKQNIYELFSQYKESYLRLLMSLENIVTTQEANQNFNSLTFLTNRITEMRTSRGEQKLVEKSLKQIKNLLKNASIKKKITKNLKRWDTLYNQAGGNKNKGKILFQSLCLACHSIKGQGQKIAPNLDGSSNRTKKGLITAIVDPSAATPKTYRATRVLLKSGQSYTGLFRKGKNQDHIYFMGGGKVSFDPYNVAYMTTSNESFMPSNIFTNLTNQQVKDLLEYIKTLK